MAVSKAEWSLFLKASILSEGAETQQEAKNIKSIIQFIEGNAWYGKQNKWDWVGEIRSTRRFNLGWSGEALLRRRHLRSKGDEGVSHASFHRKSAPGEGKASAKATDKQEVQSLEITFFLSFLRNVPGLEYSLSNVPLQEIQGLAYETPCHRHLQSTLKIKNRFHVGWWNSSVTWLGWLHECVKMHRILHQKKKSVLLHVNLINKYFEKQLNAFYFGLLKDLWSRKVGVHIFTLLIKDLWPKCFSAARGRGESQSGIHPKPVLM